MLIEGTVIEIETNLGTKARFNYAETFIVSAGAASYALTNRGDKMARVVKAILKDC